MMVAAIAASQPNGSSPAAEALRLVPPALWRHLGAQFEIDAPDLASLRTMYRRRRTLFEQQDLACSVLGFHDVTEAQRRALVRAINAELSRTSDRQRLLQFARRWLYDHKQIIPRERELRGYIAKAISKATIGIYAPENQPESHHLLI